MPKLLIAHWYNLEYVRYLKKETVILSLPVSEHIKREALKASFSIF